MREALTTFACPAAKPESKDMKRRFLRTQILFLITLSLCTSLKDTDFEITIKSLCFVH